MRPTAIAFDVVETLFSLEALDAPLAAIGAPPGLRELWFTRLLRDGFALAAAHSYVPFAQVADGALASVLPTATSEQRRGVLERFAQLDAHPDARPALEQAAEAGVRVVLLTNGSAATTRRAAVHNHLDGLIADYISIDDAQQWKPAPAPYLHLARQLNLGPAAIALVAVHAWDIHGAARSGLVTGWCSRLEGHHVATFAEPDVSGPDLPSVVSGLLSR